MGEKGNAADAVAAAQSAAGGSLIERTTTVATTTVVDAGEDLAIAVRDAAPSLVVSRLTHFAVSIADPPPTATNASHGPVSRA